LSRERARRLTPPPPLLLRPLDARGGRVRALSRARMHRAIGIANGARQ
jgi:hypothetical protein